MRCTNRCPPPTCARTTTATAAPPSTASRRVLEGINLSVLTALETVDARLGAEVGQVYISLSPVDDRVRILTCPLGPCPVCHRNLRHKNEKKMYVKIAKTEIKSEKLRFFKKLDMEHAPGMLVLFAEDAERNNRKQAYRQAHSCHRHYKPLGKI